MLGRRLIAMDANRQVLRHLARFDGLHADILERSAEIDELFVPVEFPAECEPASPSEDGSNRVRRRLLSRLMIAEVARDGAVRRFGFHRLPIGRDERGRHEAE